MIDKLQGLLAKYLEIEEQINDPEVIADMKRYVKLNKDYKELQPVVDAYKAYKNVVDNLASAKELLAKEKDEEFRAMAKEEINLLQEQKDIMEEEIRVLLLPRDPQDGKNAIVEIRAGTGGDEASIFAGDLYRMLAKFVENQGWKHELVSMTEGTAGGFKEIVFEVNGDGS
jgi:peptide chain release factor 1